MPAAADAPIRRNLAAVLRREAKRYPVVTVTGPRQSGKTTLCREVFRGKPYLSFETLDARERARQDPRGLLADLPHGAVLDEIQHVPELLSYLQSEVDERPSPGRFVLTGSQQFGLSAAISQTLAGRTAVLHLLPPSLDELRRFKKPPRGPWATLLAGDASAAPPENPMSADRVRWEHIQRVYELCNHNVSETARRLNMHRRTLQRILAKRAPR